MTGKKGKRTGSSIGTLLFLLNAKIEKFANNIAVF